MGQEIERKFLVRNEKYKEISSRKLIKQGFLNLGPLSVVRVRIIDTSAWITIKGESEGIVRAEFEYEIPLADAKYMLINLCHQPIIEKVRYQLKYRDHIWEIDEFTGENEGLVIAEVELKSQNEKLELPEWVGPEVTKDNRYYNNNLIVNPYLSWKTNK